MTDNDDLDFAWPSVVFDGIGLTDNLPAIADAFYGCVERGGAFLLTTAVFSSPVLVSYCHGFPGDNHRLPPVVFYDHYGALLTWPVASKLTHACRTCS